MVERVTVKYNAIMHEISINDLDLVPDSATDQDILTAVSRHLGIPVLTEYEIDRYPTVWQLRPDAVHG